jgi:hypothetical protein
MTPQVGAPQFHEPVQANPVAQTSLTRRDQQLQTEEGQPPLDVQQTEEEALEWKREADDSSLTKRREQRRRRRTATAIAMGAAGEEESGKPTAAEAADSEEEEETGKLFDSRS